MPFVGNTDTFQGFRRKDAGMARYGDGRDGAIVFGTTVGYTSSPHTLTQDMMATDITVPASFTVITGGYRILASGLLTTNASAVLHCDGADAVTQTGGAAGTAHTIGRGSAGGNSSNSSVGGDGGFVNSASIGGNGGAGGAGSFFAGGAGGTPGIPAFGPHNALWALLCAYPGASTGFTMYRGGCGGGGGGTGIGNAAGAGGAGGGIVLIAARRITHAGTIRAKGGAGANAQAANFGGGGGGGGGAVIMLYDYYTGAGTITAPGGAKGTGISTGVDGVAGSAGNVYTLGP